MTLDRMLNWMTWSCMIPLPFQSHSWSINSVVYVFENCLPVFTSWNSQLRLVAAWWALQMWRVTLFGLWPMLSMALVDVVYIFLVRLPNIHIRGSRVVGRMAKRLTINCLRAPCPFQGFSLGNAFGRTSVGAPQSLLNCCGEFAPIGILILRHAEPLHVVNGLSSPQ